MSMMRSISPMPSTPAQGAGCSAERLSSRADADTSVSLTSVDLPEPDTPVTQVISPIGKATSIDFRLLPRRAAHAQRPLRVALSACSGNIDALSTGQVLSGQGCRARLDVGGRALRDDAPAVHAGARAEVHDVIGLADRVLVVLDDDDRVAEVAQPVQRVEQALVVALVQADRRLVQDVHDADQARADLARQPDALGFAARERLRAAIERQVVEPDVDQEAEPVGDLLDDLGGDVRAPALELERREEVQRAAYRQRGDRGQGDAADKDDCAPRA